MNNNTKTSQTNTFHGLDDNILVINRHPLHRGSVDLLDLPDLLYSGFGPSRVGLSRHYHTLAQSVTKRNYITMYFKILNHSFHLNSVAQALSATAA